MALNDSHKLGMFKNFNTQKDKIRDSIFTLDQSIPNWESFQDQPNTSPVETQVADEQKLLGTANINYNIFTFPQVEFWKFKETILIRFADRSNKAYLFPNDCVLEKTNFKSPFQMTAILTKNEELGGKQSNNRDRSTHLTIHLSNVTNDLASNLISYTNNLKLDTTFHNKTSGLSCGWPTNFLTAKLPLKLSKILEKTDWTVVSNNQHTITSKPIKRNISSFDSNMNQLPQPSFEHTIHSTATSQTLTNHKPNPSGQKICFHCHCKSTPMWRRGPSGPGTLCNACGVKWKNGKILKEFPQNTKDPTASLASALPQQKTPSKTDHDTRIELSASAHSEHSVSPEFKANFGSSHYKSDDDSTSSKTIQTPIKKRKFVPKSCDLTKEQSGSTLETLPES